MTGSGKSKSDSTPLKLSNVQREVLVGILLGDGHLESRSNNRSFRLKVEQSAKHRAYVEHLFHVFENWTTSPVKFKVRKTSGRSSSTSCWFRTKSDVSFRFYFHQFYSAGKKSVPKLIHRWLTPRSIAYWYMDDGSIKSRQSKGVIFNTKGFEKPGVELLIDVLNSKFDLLSTLRRQKDGWQIYVSGKSFETFHEIVDPFILEDMRYKIPPARRTQMPKE